MRAPGKRTLHRRLAAGIIVVILVAAAAWYTRPVDLYALSPDLGEPQDLTCLLLATPTTSRRTPPGPWT